MIGRLARRTLADARTRNASFALFFGVVALMQPSAYRHSFPTLAQRAEFARDFGDNKAIRLFYGVPHDLLSTGGYTAWRVGGFMAIFAGMFGLLAAVRALRTEEDAGRQELVLAGAVSRGAAFAGAMAGVAVAVAAMWLALLLGLVAGRLPAGPSGFLALATVTPAIVFAGAGALVSQLAPSRRTALELGSALLVSALLLRVVADTSSSLTWLRWTTPLGWAEELRPFAAPRPAVLLLPLSTGALLAVASLAIAVRRDVGSGLLSAADSRAPREALLGSPLAQALRTERGSLIGWATGIGFFAAILGAISDTFSTAKLSENLKQQLAKFGGASITTPSGALGFYFLFFVLAISLFACSQIAAARHEEADQRLETLLALRVGRTAWLAGRLALAVAGCAGLALAAGVLAWAGAATQGADVHLADMLGAGANTLPAALLFLAIGALAYAALPRASAGLAYGAVSVAFVWELFGALLGAPAWTLDLSPFHHVGLVPAQDFKAGSAAIMLAAATVLIGVALYAFRRRDLSGA